MTSITELLQQNSGIRLDIACGGNKTPGFIGLDIRELPGVDIVWNAEVQPWPLPDECVIQALCSHYVEHINPANFGFINFMNEVWRVMKFDAQFIVQLPYGGSPRYWQDPTHINGCNEVTWAYFDPIVNDAPSQLYAIYKPRPWKVTSMRWDVMGDIEVVMSKRRLDVSYE